MKIKTITIPSFEVNIDYIYEDIDYNIDNITDGSETVEEYVRTILANMGIEDRIGDKGYWLIRPNLYKIIEDYTKEKLKEMGY